MRYIAVSDVGCIRKNNEDMAYAVGRLIRDGRCEGECDAAVCAFAVADGMGGYEGGEVASEVVCRSFSSFMNGFAPADENEAITALKEWAKEANGLVLDTAAVRPELAEMGTTFVGLVFAAGVLLLINIGDSRCYRRRGGILKQLSADHSERERTGDPQTPSNLIYNFMGNHPEDFFSDVTLLKPSAGDIYLICSDGLSDLVDSDSIEAHADDAAALVDMAKAAGGRDNITVITLLC